MFGQGNYREFLRMKESRLEPDELSHASIANSRRGNVEAGFRLAEQALESRAPYANTAMGEAYEASGQMEEALHWYESDLRCDFSGRAARRAATMLDRLGDHREAAVLWRRALRSQSFLRPDWLAAFALTCERIGDHDSGERALRLAAKG
jgi:tetratricopeptide (TPR) repeat protein